MPKYDYREPCAKCGTASPRPHYGSRQIKPGVFEEWLDCVCLHCDFKFKRRCVDSDAPLATYTLLKTAAKKARARIVARIASAIEEQVKGAPGKTLAKLIRLYDVETGEHPLNDS